MILYLLYIFRIFSEQVNYLSPIIGGILLLLTIDQILLRKSDLNFKGNGPFFNFWVVYTLITFIWIFVSCFYYGSTIIVSGLYLTMKPLSILCLFILLKSEKFIRKEKLLKLLIVIIYIYAGIAIIDSFGVITGKLDNFTIIINDEIRAVWPLNHPNSLGAIFSVLIAYLILTNNKILLKKTLIIILSIGLLSTKSLSSIAILLIVFCVFYSKKKDIKKILIFAILIPVLYFTIGELLIGGRLKALNSDLKHYSYVWNHKISITRYNPWTNSLEWRLANWRNFYDIFKRYPLLGKGTLSWMIDNPYRNTPGKLGGYNPHSEFFGWIAQFGLVGTIILLYYTIKTCYILLITENNTGRAFNAIFASLLITGLLGKEILYVPIYYLLMIDIFSEQKKVKHPQITSQTVKRNGFFLN